MKKKICRLFLGMAMTFLLTGCAKTENNTVPTPTNAPMETVVTNTSIPTPTEVPHEHVWKSVATEATCTTDGHSVEKCECGETQNETIIPATGHLEYTYWVAVNPSVETEGEYGNICNACGAVVNRGSIPKLTPTPTPTPIEFSYKKVSLEDAAVGCVVEFGFYEQNNDLTNGTEPIEWIVLDVQGEKALLLSRYGLDHQRYNEEYKEVTWETCTVRTWLNDTFYNTAFTGEQQDKIVTTWINTPDNEKCGTEGGNDTYDNIFLLSMDEAEQYFPDDEANGDNKYRATSPTVYAKAQGVWTYPSSPWYEGNCNWWLRSSGKSSDFAVYVYSYGYVNELGYYANDSGGAVRPALWIDLTLTEVSHEHVWKVVTTEATCTTDGHSIELCNCGEVQNKIAVPATGHLEYTYWVMVKPSVENEGEYRNVCNTCGAIVDSGSIPKLTPEFSYEKVSMEDAAVGCVVEFGFYEQDNDLNNGTEPIEWIVLDVQGEKALLLSRYGLDCKRYNDEYEEVTWETCTVRTWLNDTFYNTAFTGEQQDKIVTTRINTPDNEVYGTEGGNDTYDNIFYLSKEEADKYFPKGEGSENKYRATSATAYAQAQGATALESSKWYNGNCLWDLRSPGMVHNLVVRVQEHGYVGSMGGSVYGKHSVGRPALWVNLTP